MTDTPDRGAMTVQASEPSGETRDKREPRDDDGRIRPGKAPAVADAAARPHRASAPDAADPFPPAPSSMRGFSIAEIVICVALVLWIQVVGVVTERIATHVVHALPFVPFLVVRKTGWVRLTAVVACLFWIFALSLMSPMVRHSVVEGGLWRDAGLFPWLAPGVAFLCAVSAALNLAILARAPRACPLFLVGALLLIVALAMVRPAAHAVFTVPIAGVLTGRPVWVVALVVELVVGVALFWYATVRLTRRSDLRWTDRILLWQGLFWAFFVGCTALGVPHAAFPDM